MADITIKGKIAIDGLESEFSIVATGGGVEWNHWGFRDSDHLCLSAQIVRGLIDDRGVTFPDVIQAIRSETTFRAGRET